MLAVFLMKGKPRIIDTDDFDELWHEILGFKKLNMSKAEESSDLVGLQDEHGRMLLLALYDRDHWVLETLEKDWDTPFKKMDLAGNFDVEEVILDDNQLRMTIKKIMTKGRLSLQTKHA